MALERKNYLFAGSHNGAKRSAVFYNFFACCKLNNINHQKWLNYVLENIADHQANDLLIYPNPNQDGHITVEISGECSDLFEVEVFNITGKLVYHNQSLKTSGNGNSAQIDIDLVSGSYIIRLKGCGSVYQNKLVILK